MVKMDYNTLEELWSSNNLDNLVKFYKFVNSPEKAYDFSINRRKADIRVYHLNNHSRLCFIIPTISVDEFLKTPYWGLVSEFDAIVVESYGQYFNYARSVNHGIREALKYDYSTLILSNDDMIVIDNKDKLLGEIENLKEFDVILPTKVRTHRSSTYIADQFSIVNLDLIAKSITYIGWFMAENSTFNAFRAIFNDLDGYKYTVFESGSGKGTNNLILKFLKTKYDKLPLFNSFGIFQRPVLENENMNEAFINAREDYEFIVRLVNDKFSFVKSSFKIADIGGQSMNKYYSSMRGLKSLLSELILNYFI